MSTVIASNVLANGLRTEFADTYSAIRNRQADSRLGLIMDLSVTATNRDHDFAYFEAAPHMEYWRRGDSVPTKAMGSKTFNVPIYEWARRIPWSKFDRKDDQTQSLMEVARMAGESASLLPERFLFDLIIGTASTLPAVPTAPDGAVMYSATAGGADRFGVSGGNLLTGSGITNIASVQNDYYEAIEQFKQFQDGQGQPLLSDETIDAGVCILHAAEDTEVMEQTFLQQRQGIGYTAAGIPATGTPASGVLAVSSESNLVHDSSRNVQLWGTSRLATGDWYVFLKNPPKKATFFLSREGVQEFTSLEGDNNGDHTRTTGEEYVQWEERAGAGIALPYGTIKVNN